MRLDDGAVLDVDPAAARVVSAGLRRRSLAVAAQRRVCDGIDVVGADPTIAAGLGRFSWTWGSAVTGLARELDLLGVALAKSADGVTAVDRDQVRVR